MKMHDFERNLRVKQCDLFETESKWNQVMNMLKDESKIKKNGIFCLIFRWRGLAIMRNKDCVRLIPEGTPIIFWISLSYSDRFHDIWLIKSNIGKANYCNDSMKTEKAKQYHFIWECIIDLRWHEHIIGW